MCARRGLDWQPGALSPQLDISLFWTNWHKKDPRVTDREAGRVQLGQRAAIYARVSIADQSCERQLAELTAFAKRGGFEVLGIFRGRNSRCCRTEPRPGRRVLLHRRDRRPDSQP